MVYFKVWTDHSFNDVWGLRLTVNFDNGNILQAGLVTLVTIAGTAFWSITAYVLFRLLARKQRTDGLGASIRLLLANSRGTGMDIWTLFKLGLRWHRHNNLALLRSFSIMVLALVLWIGWTAASIFVSKAATYGRGNHLAPIEPTTCGLRDIDTSSVKELSAWNNMIEEETRAAQIWVKDCYKPYPDPLRCTGPPVARLNYTGSSAPCPWPENRCLPASNGAWRMRTLMIDSHQHLGINARESDRIGVTLDFTCSVIKQADVVTEVPDPQASSADLVFKLFRYNFGPVPGSPNWTWEYATRMSYARIGYQITPFPFKRGDNSTQLIPSMQRSDADTVLLFFASNDVVYLGENQDPLYNASIKIDDRFLSNLSVTADRMFTADNWVRVVACLQQYQFHNPSMELTSPLMSLNIAYKPQLKALQFNQQQMVTLARIYRALLECDIYSSISSLSGKALLADSLVWNNISPKLPDDQWISEVQYWFEVALAKVGRYIVEFPTNSQSIGKDYVNIEDPSFDIDLLQQCETQLASTRGLYQTFSLLAIIIIAIISTLIIVFSWTIAWWFATCTEPRELAVENGYQMHSILVGILEERGYKGFLQTGNKMPVRLSDMRDIPNPIRSDDGRLSFPRYREMAQEEDSELEDEVDGIRVEEVEMLHHSDKQKH